MSLRARILSPGRTEAAAGGVSGPMPDKVEAQLATLAAVPPEGADWLHEVKFDGYRMLARIDGGKATFKSRNGNDWSAKFPELSRLLPKLPVDGAILDGEVCFVKPDGVTGFSELQAAISDKKTAGLIYFIFDLLYLNGYRLDGAALLHRKMQLARIMKNPPDDRLRYSDHHVGQGPEFFAAVKNMQGIEGIVSKKADAPYRPGRGTT